MPIFITNGIQFSSGINLQPAQLELTLVVPSSTFTAGTAITVFTPVTVSNGVGTEVFTISPALPSGLSLNSSTGEISGTPNISIDSTTFTITVTNSYGFSSKTLLL